MTAKHSRGVIHKVKTLEPIETTIYEYHHKIPVTWSVFEKNKPISPYLLFPVSLLITTYVFFKKRIYKITKKIVLKQKKATDGAILVETEKNTNIEFTEDGAKLKVNSANHLPKINSLFFDGLGELLSSDKKINSPLVVKNCSGTVFAMKEIYDYQFDKPTKKTGDWLAIKVSDFWEDMLNTRALRNRLKLIRQTVRNIILEQHKKHPNEEIRICSLACGSSQAILEVMTDFKVKGIKVRALLADISPSALDHAKEIAQQFGISDQIETLREDALNVKNFTKDFQPHIIEMLGLMDYLDDKTAFKIFSEIYKTLNSEGVFLTCNIIPNSEMWFVKEVINWTMIHRTPKQLLKLADQAGFQDKKVLLEPVGIHGIMICCK